jgi:hypothetical protein
MTGVSQTIVSQKGMCQDRIKCDFLPLGALLMGMRLMTLGDVDGAFFLELLDREAAAVLTKQGPLSPIGSFRLTSDGCSEG